MSLPILYSYRRCPYAMRARMALRYAGIQAEMREIALRDKPQHMLQASPKATVPVLLLSDGRVIDESLDIMHWALAQRDTEHWLAADMHATAALIEENDGSFKQALDCYKYAIHFPEQPAEIYRSEGEVFLQKLELGLVATAYLFGETRTLADIAIFPFVRQFSMVDTAWFGEAPYPALRIWLRQLMESALFVAIMQKTPAWIEPA